MLFHRVHFDVVRVAAYQGHSSWFIRSMQIASAVLHPKNGQTAVCLAQAELLVNKGIKLCRQRKLPKHGTILPANTPPCPSRFNQQERSKVGISYQRGNPKAAFLAPAHQPGIHYQLIGGQEWSFA